MLTTLLAPLSGGCPCPVLPLSLGGPLRLGPTAFLAGQGKAFERISHAWTQLVFACSGAPIWAVDVDASNGVIHVIDTVMVPADVDVTALLAG